MIQYIPNPNPYVEWVIVERYDDVGYYGAHWAIYKEDFLQGLMVRMTATNGFAEEPLPAWMTVA
jgi:hypothetical protein